MLFALGCPVLAYAPQWNEFCPPQYVNAVPKDHFVGGYLLGVTRNNFKEYDYWAGRKTEFDREIQYASQLPQDQLDGYFAHIRIMENNKNNVYYSQLQSTQAKALQGIQRATTFMMFY